MLVAYREVVTHSRGRVDEKMRTSVYLDKNVGLFPFGQWEQLKGGKVRQGLFQL